MTKPEGEVT